MRFFTTLNSQSTTVLRSSPSIMAQRGMVRVGSKKSTHTFLSSSIVVVNEGSGGSGCKKRFHEDKSHPLLLPYENLLRLLPPRAEIEKGKQAWNFHLIHQKTSLDA